MSNHRDDDPPRKSRDASAGVAIENLVQHRRQRRGEQRARKDDGPMAEVWKSRRPDSRLAELRERQQWRAATIQIIKEQERAHRA